MHRSSSSSLLIYSCCRSSSSSLLMSASQRTGMIRSHLSANASSSAPHQLPKEPVVIFEAIHSLRKMILNRPKALNALDSDMIALMRPQLQKWEESELANVILFKGNGKSFCAGGDVVTLVKQLDDPATWSKSSEFFKQEYATDAYIAKMKKPVVTIMHGNTLGGGVGLSVHAPFRIATESTKIAMPETTIGLFPDVGANFFLSRLDGQLGLYFGLTSDRVVGVGALLAGFATHFVPSERLPALEARLAELAGNATHRNVNDAIEEFVADADEMREGAAAYELVGCRRRAIDAIFARETAEEIVLDLKALEEGNYANLLELVLAKEGAEREKEVEGLKKWAKKTRTTIESRSPTSVKVSLRAIREGRVLDIDEAFELDMRIATACCNPEVHPDFKNGVTALLINKDPSSVKWQPATLAAVDPASVQSIFFSTPAPFDNPPLPRLGSKHSALAYKVYPHAHFSLPSEKEIQDVVTGEAKGSGPFAMTADEVVKKLVGMRNGKAGVREKVVEVLRRRCSPDELDTIKWGRYV